MSCSGVTLPSPHYVILLNTLVNDSSNNISDNTVSTVHDDDSWSYHLSEEEYDSKVHLSSVRIPRYSHLPLPLPALVY